MVRCPLIGLEGVEAFACSNGAATVAACRLAAAAIPALPIRNRRREGEGGAGGAMSELSSVAGLMVDLIDFLARNKTVNQWCLWHSTLPCDCLKLSTGSAIAQSPVRRNPFDRRSEVIGPWSRTLSTLGERASACRPFRPARPMTLPASFASPVRD